MHCFFVKKKNYSFVFDFLRDSEWQVFTLEDTALPQGQFSKPPALPCLCWAQFPPGPGHAWPLADSRKPLCLPLSTVTIHRPAWDLQSPPKSYYPLGYSFQLWWPGKPRCFVCLIYVSLPLPVRLHLPLLSRALGGLILVWMKGHSGGKKMCGQISRHTGRCRRTSLLFQCSPVTFCGRAFGETATSSERLEGWLCNLGKDAASK